MLRTFQVPLVYAEGQLYVKDWQIKITKSKFDPRRT